MGTSIGLLLYINTVILLFFYSCRLFLLLVVAFPVDGDLVDLMVGALVRCGALVDLTVGALVDLTVGDFVDLIVGALVDLTVGALLDLIVGDLVDLMVGILVDDFPT